MKSHSILMVMALILAVLVGTSPSYAKLISLTQNVSHSQRQSACNAAGASFPTLQRAAVMPAERTAKVGKAHNATLPAIVVAHVLGRHPAVSSPM